MKTIASAAPAPALQDAAALLKAFATVNDACAAVLQLAALTRGSATGQLLEEAALQIGDVAVGLLAPRLAHGLQPLESLPSAGLTRGH